MALGSIAKYWSLTFVLWVSAASHHMQRLLHAH